MMRRYLLLAMLLSLCGCVRVKLVGDKTVPNAYQRCLGYCSDEGAGPAKVAVETEDAIKCYCTPRPNET